MGAQTPRRARATIQVAAVPMRQAAAQLRQWLLARATQQLNVPRKTLYDKMTRLGIVPESFRR